jgi:HK97 family phage major capsid protein
MEGPVNRLMERLQAQYNSLFASYDGIMNRCADQGRDPVGSEVELLDGLRSEMDALGPRLTELQEVEQRRFATVLPMPGETGDGLVPVVHVRGEAEVYRPPDASGGERLSFFRDLLHAQLDQEPEARSRIDRHSLQVRATGTTTTGAGVVPPTWLFEEFAILQHGARPWADTLRKVGITDANPVNIGVQATPGAAVTAQASEGAAPNDGSFNTTILTTNPKTYTGKTDVSRQLIDGSNPAIDSLVYADTMGSYNEQIEQAVVNAFEAATGFAATITYPGSPAYANLPDAFIDASASVNRHRKMPARVVFLSIGAWAFLTKQKDQQGRPLVTTGASGPMNAYGTAASQTQYTDVAGEVVGLNCVPSWAGVDNHIYVAKHDDLLLLESSTFNFRYEEVLGPSAIRLGVWGYAAPVVARYPAAIAKIDAGSTIPAPQEMEAEPAVGPGTGEGPGTPRAPRK